MVLATKTKRPNTSIRHKKRYGQHRKQTKPFKETYWPYLPILLIFSVGLVINSHWSHKASNVSLSNSNISNVSVLTSINDLRTQNHLQNLSENSSLSSAAQLEANQISVSADWSADNSDINSLATSVQQSGYSYENLGENFSYGLNSSQSIVSAWGANQTYRSSLLNPEYKDAGFGYAISQNFNNKGPAIIVVALYGQPKFATAVSTDQQNIQLASFKAPAQTIVLGQVIFKQYSYLFLLILPLLVIGSLAVFIIRHSLIWHKALIKGEAFVIKNPWLDIMVISIFTLSFLLGHSVGGIQ